MKTRLLALSFLSVLFMVYSCKNGEIEINESLYSDEEYQVISQYLNIPDNSIDYTLHFPAYYRTPAVTTDNEMATLGRVLFYDKNLSEDRTISCASCHKQELAFADDVPLSKGINDRSTERNSLALGAVFSFSEYYGSASLGRIPFMWDNRAESVGQQSKIAFTNKDEMGLSMNQVVSRVNEQPYYEPLFKKAFGYKDVSEELVLQALDAFVNSMGTNQSKFDHELEKVANNFGSARADAIKDFPGYTQKENTGKAIYINNCASCHGRVMEPARFIAGNNGLDLNYTDQGIGRINNQAKDQGKFKIPTLRNVALTAPYMHDGRFATLEEAIDHYSNGIKDHVNLNYELRNNEGEPKKFNFTADEKEALIAFFKTLTDESYITDTKFSNPFK